MLPVDSSQRRYRCSQNDNNDEKTAWLVNAADRHAHGVCHYCDNYTSTLHLLMDHPSLLKQPGAISYRPAFVETYIISHLSAWGWDKASSNVPGCDIWTDPAATTDNVHSLLNSFRTKLKDYYK
eukprot:scaffold23080_cov75-Attheya_sp.AAC.3